MKKLRFIFMFLLVVSPLQALGECKDFTAWKLYFKEKQKEKGFSEEVLTSTIDDAVFQQKIINSDRKQPEFSFNFNDYLKRLHSDIRVSRAIKKYKELKTELKELEEKYGVAGEYLIAFWAVETNFGEYQGKLKTKDALATLSCDSRRSTFFEKEYDIFMRLVAEGKIPENALSSWAGAMGHLQFLPNKIEKYALDGDGDGKIDIFSNRKDAFETAVNYLKGEAWQKGLPWGQSVILPQKINGDYTGRRNKKTVEEWAKLGVKTTDGGDFIFPSEEKVAIIVLKSGESFMTSDNFDVIMIWNHSLHYALAIGLLADKIRNAEKYNMMK